MTRTLVLIANASDATISAFTLAADGQEASLRHLATTALDGGCSTFAVDAGADLVYAGVKGDPHRIVTLRLDRESGRLDPLAETPIDASATYLTLARHGTLLLGTSYGGGFGAVWGVDGGVLTDPVARVDYPNVHCVVASADDRHAYFVSLGADLIAQYELGEDGALTPLDPPAVDAPAGSGPRHLILNDASDTAYLVTEFTGEAIRLTRDPSGVLTRREAVRAYDTDSGLTASVFGADPTEHHLIWGADLHLVRDERYLLCSERSESTLATVSLDDDGALVGVVALTATEKQPRGFCASPDGRHVVCVGEKSTHATLYAVAGDGSLDERDRVHTGAGANWVRMVPLD